VESKVISVSTAIKKVKEFHLDVDKDGKVSDLMSCRVIQVYEILLFNVCFVFQVLNI
jgi:hypothetical protein